MKWTPYLVVPLLLLANNAMAQDAFSQGVTWFIGGPARGVAMLAVAAIAVGAWMLTASLRIVSLVLGGGVALANVDTVVGWMGF
jgi:hypothetical protein